MQKPEFKYDESKYKNQFLETSDFEVLFPRHRSQYLQSVEKYILKACEAKKVKVNIDYKKCILKVVTTEQTRDPYIIIKAYEFIQLLGKGVLLENCCKVLEDGIQSEIVPIHMLVSNRKVFERRRKRLLNPKIFNALQIITKCHILISNKSASIIGDYRGVNDAKNIIVKCFENIHPAFELKALIIKKRLLQDKIEGDWERFLPKIKKTHSNKKVKARISGNMPEEIRSRKEDIDMETGLLYVANKTGESNKNRTNPKDKEVNNIFEKYCEPQE